MSITYEIGTTNKLYPDIIPYFDKHFEESTGSEPEHRYGPHQVRIADVMAAGVTGGAWMIVACDEDIVVGYAVYLIDRNTLFKQRLEAQNIQLWVDKACRGSVTYEMLNRIETHLETLGVNEIAYAVSDKRLGRLLRRRGFTDTHVVWVRDIV